MDAKTTFIFWYKHFKQKDVTKQRGKSVRTHIHPGQKKRDYHNQNVWNINLSKSFSHKFGKVRWMLKIA
ncbi:hypothetical protein lacNasYZ02_11180 [Lactobacillus nasalidis]|nr:hypothetical protein lacNasYZ02_11180 [Lactobacillus nasalidis]